MTVAPDAVGAPSGRATITAAAATPAVRIEGVSKSFGAVVAVDDVDLEIADGEFFTLLGPSGSGKTTLLRLIAGFELPTAGRILLHGADMTNLAPFDRDVNTVFQDYALFPHMNVAQNVAYGLMVRRVARPERARRVEEALAAVRLEGFGGRRPSELSGGQRQRVALARALVNRPRVLLLDEPLGALDLKLREEMQIELKSLQDEVGITFVFVTHDQEEALTMSDRIAVFNRGRVEQIGTPSEVYERPRTAFVAGFVGASNLFTGPVATALLGRAGTFTVRPEKIRLAEPGTRPLAGELAADGVIEQVQYAGAVTRYRVRVDVDQAGAVRDGAERAQLLVSSQNLSATSLDASAAQGRAVVLLWREEHVYAVDAVPSDGS